MFAYELQTLECFKKGFVMEDLTGAVENLKLNEKTESTAEACLDCILKALEEDVEKASDHLAGQDAVTVFVNILKESKCDSVTMKLAKVIAEMAKNEHLRDSFVKSSVILTLNNLLNHSDPEVVLQVCRALGNICCDNDEGRTAICESSGIEMILEVLTKLTSPQLEEAFQRVRLMACSYFLNLTCGNEILQTKAISCGAIDVFLQLSNNNKENMVLCEKVILALGSLADFEKNKGSFVGSGMSELLVEALKLANDEEQLESLLETIASLAENDMMKLEFAQQKIVEALLDIADKYVKPVQPQASFDQEFDVGKVATDIIVLLLTGDESMRYLFNDGQSSLFKKVMSEWLVSTNEMYQISAALALGNFARSDDHCSKLVELGVVKPLLQLLENPNRELDIKLGHAVLSALRNLSIPKVNKPEILKAGTLETICPLLESEMHPVQFKLLGTIRMLIDGQGEVALQLGENNEFVSRVVEMSECEVHAGVAGEANRLLAALIKHSGATNVMQVILQNGGIPKLVSMATSEHELMQNEALVAITLVASSHLGPSVPALVEGNLVDVLSTILDSERITVEVKCNALSLIGFLTQSEEMMSILKTCGLKEKIEALQHTDKEALLSKSGAILEHFK